MFADTNLRVCCIYYLQQTSTVAVSLTFTGLQTETQNRHHYMTSAKSKTMMQIQAA